jgi:putative acetyltransferase
MSTVLQIRKATHDDAGKIIEAHRRSIREVCAKDYSPAQIAAWSGRDFKPERWQQTMDRDQVWVISDNEKKIYGFGHLQIKENNNAEIAGLYFVPELIGKGFGKKLAQIIFDECKKKNVTNINLYATLTAKAFYESVGFRPLEITSITLGDESIDCVRMVRVEKPLA